MPLLVDPQELKSAARIAAQVKLVNATAIKRDAWNGVHRLESSGGRFRLLTKDGSTSLDWSIPVKEPSAEDFGINVSAIRFNAIAGNSADGGLYSVTRSAGHLILSQGARTLRLAEEFAGTYPPIPILDGDLDRTTAQGNMWTTKAEGLARALAFVAPFIDASNPRPARSVATWTDAGLLEGGSPRAIALTAVRDAPLVPLSFKQRAAKVVATFLDGLGGDVEIRVEGTSAMFASPAAGHRLKVERELVVFENPLVRLDGLEHESLHIDRKSFLNAATLLGLVLAGGDRLDLRVRGRGEHSSIRISTPGDDTQNSSDEFAIHRRPVECIGAQVGPAEASNCTLRDFLTCRTAVFPGILGVGGVPWAHRDPLKQS